MRTEAYYLAEQQIVSGTLSYAMAAGNAIVSTPYLYAKEVLADNRERLVPFRDSDAIAREVSWLLENETERHDIRKRAYLSTRNMVWKEVARSYLDLCDDVLSKSLALSVHPASVVDGSRWHHVLLELRRLEAGGGVYLPATTGLLTSRMASKTGPVQPSLLDAE